MYFDLSSLITPDPDLDWLESPFIKEEIDKIIGELPNNKSPGLDGFNWEFLKRCWHLIAEDFYKLCEGFYDRNVCVQSINASYIIDDTLLVMEVDPSQLLHLKHLLNQFANSTGLKINYNKTVMVPLNISEERSQELSLLFNCQVGSLPFTYLGLPLGTTKSNIAGFMPLIKRVQGSLGGISNLLTKGGKLELVNSVFCSSPIFHMATLKLHKGVIRQLYKYRKHCLWRGQDLNSKKPSKAAWPMVCLSKPQGGLGVINLNTQNDALLLSFYTSSLTKLTFPGFI